MQQLKNLDSPQNVENLKKINESKQAVKAEEEGKKQVIRKRFDPKALAADTKKIHIIPDPDLGDIRFGFLTDTEVKNLKLKEFSETQSTEKLVWAMLHKADPTLTYAEFQSIRFDIKTAVIVVLSKQFSGFLRFVQRNGLVPSLNSETKPQSPSPTDTA